MSQVEIKRKAITGALWSFCERFGSLIILFFANVVLARLLTPDDYGLVAILLTFVAFFQILIDGGFGSAIVQKKDLTSDDCSTVFYINIFVAIFCYMLLVFSSEYIAGCFKQSQLINLIPILGLVVVFDALSAIQNNILIKELNFKKISIIKIIAALISSSAAIIIAIKGFGVWALVAQYLLNSVMKSLLLWGRTKWIPSLTFKKESFNSLFNYGSKLLISNVIFEAYYRLQVFILGWFFPPRIVGLYSQAKHLQDVPVSTMQSVVNQVTFPVFSKLQDDYNQLRNVVSRNIQLISYLITPVMLMMVATATPLVELMFGEKWLDCVPYLQVLCIGIGVFYPIHSANHNVIKAIGRTDLLLIIEIIKRIIGIGLILSAIIYGFGIMGVLYAITISTLIEFVINAFVVGKCIRYTIFMQVKDVIVPFFISCVAGFCVYWMQSQLQLTNILALFSQVICFCIIYLIMSKVMRLNSFEYLIDILKELKQKRAIKK